MRRATRVGLGRAGGSAAVRPVLGVTKAPVPNRSACHGPRRNTFAFGMRNVRVDRLPPATTRAMILRVDIQYGHGAGLTYTVQYVAYRASSKGVPRSEKICRHFSSGRPHRQVARHPPVNRAGSPHPASTRNSIPLPAPRSARPADDENRHRPAAPGAGWPIFPLNRIS